MKRASWYLKWTFHRNSHRESPLERLLYTPSCGYERTFFNSPGIRRHAWAPALRCEDQTIISLSMPILCRYTSPGVNLRARNPDQYFRFRNRHPYRIFCSSQTCQLTCSLTVARGVILTYALATATLVVDPYTETAQQFLPSRKDYDTIAISRGAICTSVGSGPHPHQAEHGSQPGSPKTL